MESFEPKRLALIRILQILKQYSDYDHPLKQEDIVWHLKRDYGILLERKAVGRNISLLKEAGYDIESTKEGSYLVQREFEDSELRMLIDGVLSSKYITPKHSKELIEKLCGLSNEYFRSHIKNIRSVQDWSKTDNQALFYNIELIDDAIERKRQIQFDYNKYDVDKKLHKSYTHCVTPYQLILHNQRYYLMAHSEQWGHLVFYRVDRITQMIPVDQVATSITKLPGFERGIDYKVLASALPYMYPDKIESIEFVAHKEIVDQIIDWFGTDIKIVPKDEHSIVVSLKASPKAMTHWAMQYIDYVEITKPASLRNKIQESLRAAQNKYQ